MSQSNWYDTVMNSEIKNALTVWLVFSLLGLAIIILVPENLFGSKQLFALSDQHGPTFSDAIGLLLLLIGWLHYLWRLWSNRAYISSKNRAVFYAGTAILSIAGCIIAARYNLNWLIAVLALSALSAQIMAGRLVNRS